MAPNTSFYDDPLYRRGMVILVLFAALIMLKLGADILAPIGLAMFLVALAWPVKTLLNQHLPESLSYAGSFAALTIVLVIFGSALYFSAAEIIETAPKYKADISRFWKEAKYELAVNGVDTSQKVKLEELRNAAFMIMSNFHGTLISLVLVVAYVMLALPEITSWKSKLRISLGKERAAAVLSTSEQMGKSFQHYLVAMFLCGAISSLVTGVIVFMLGLDLFVTWTVLAFVLSFVPIIGAFLTVIPPAFLAFFQFEGLSMALVTLGTLGAAHMVLGNIIEPKIQGRMLSLSPLVVLLSLSVWAFLWGIIGALLAAPLTHGIVIACSHHPRTRWIACLLTHHTERRERREMYYSSYALEGGSQG